MYRMFSDALLTRVCSVLMVVVSVFSLSGCATIVNGTNQTVEIRTAPHGADVLVDGRLVGTSPVKAEMRRGQSHIVRVEKEGYVSETTMTTTKWNSKPFMNVLVGPASGMFMMVDLATDAGVDVSPRAVAVDMVPDVTPASQIRPAEYEPSSSEGRVQLQ
jgi:hypothetical protein